MLYKKRGTVLYSFGSNLKSPSCCIHTGLTSWYKHLLMPSGVYIVHFDHIIPAPTFEFHLFPRHKKMRKFQISEAKNAISRPFTSFLMQSSPFTFYIFFPSNHPPTILFCTIHTSLNPVEKKLTRPTRLLLWSLRYLHTCR